MGLKARFELKLGSFELRQELSVEKGEILALMGSSGSGKSLSLDVLAGLIPPDSGYAELDGKLLFDLDKKLFLKAEKREVGYLFQGSALFDSMNVIKNVIAASKLRDKKEQLQEARESLSLFKAGNLAERSVQSLSGGERQRVALARLFVQKPKLLLVDEPCSALDAPLKWQFESLLKKRLPGFSCPVIYVSHDRDEVLHIADKIQLIDEGKNFAARKREDFFLDPINVSAAKMSGCKNILKAKLRGNKEQAKLIFSELDFGMLLEGLNLESDFERVRYVGLRAHDIRIVQADSKKDSEGLCLKAVLEGPFVDYLLLTNTDEAEVVVASKPGEFRLLVGKRFQLFVDAERLYFFGEGGERVR